MDLNEAMRTARHGGKVRDDANMKPDWSIMFFANEDRANMARDPLERNGLFFYVDPRGEKAHKIIFTDAHRASAQWRTIP